MASTPIDLLLSRLTDVEKTSSGWVATCPTHDDSSPSLDLAQGSDGKALVICRAGCDTAKVLAAIGLSMADLLPKTERADRTPTATYEYRSETGDPLFQVVRFSPKGFAQRRRVDDRWVWDLKGVRRVLYRLPELLATPDADVLFVEGEKDADRLGSLGFVATTCPGGAGKWRPEYREALRGRCVFILPDNDEPGRKHAREVEAGLDGIPAAVRIIELPDLPPKGDVSDWLDRGGTVEELRRLLDRSESTAQDDRPSAGEDAGGAVGGAPRRALPVGEFLATDFPLTRWRCDGLLPGEGLAVLIGADKAGKSLAADQLALCHAGGVPFLGHACEPCPVLLIEEEGSGPSMQDRLRRQAARLGLSHRVGKLPLHVAVRERFRVDRPEDITELEAEIVRTGSKLAIMGPLAQLAAIADENRSTEINAIARSLVGLAARHHVLFVLIHHRRKVDQKSGPPRTIREFFDSARGSNALMGAVDAGLGISRDPGGSDGILYVLLRDGPGERIHFTFDVPSLTIWPVAAPVKVHARAPLADVEACVLGAGTFVNRGWVAERLEVSPTTAGDRLKVLAADGRLATASGPRNVQLYGPPPAPDPSIDALTGSRQPHPATGADG